ncbi:MAG: serine/threonine-protein kinase, partial [Phototrophicaceae bacterium]
MSSQFPVFAKYHVERQLGEGGMGFVLLARSRENSRWVALKILRPEFNGMRWRFEREARIMKQLRDAGVSNIVTIYDYGVANDGQHHYIAMDYIDNGSLKDVLKGRLFTIQETYSILRMILPPLHHAHQMDIFHRDLKPSNILIDRQGQAYLADFGVATDPDLNNPQTKLMNAVIGTPAYMSPEAHKGFKVTPADEVYSIGVTAFEMLVGKVPRELDRDKAFHY